uniref:Tumor protein p53-inducible protein 11 n=1 Tax=Sus scrofa TaxID=9823 RepID=A0A8D0PHR4_PIG
RQPSSPRLSGKSTAPTDRPPRPARAWVWAGGRRGRGPCSKISQVLGSEIKSALREPLGLRDWPFVSACSSRGDTAITALQDPPPPRPLHRGAVLSIFLIVWDAFYTAEKVISRWTLLTEACEFGVQGLVVTATLPETGLVSLGILLLLATPLPFCRHQNFWLQWFGQKEKKKKFQQAASSHAQPPSNALEEAERWLP